MTDVQSTQQLAKVAWKLWCRCRLTWGCLLDREQNGYLPSGSKSGRQVAVLKDRKYFLQHNEKAKMLGLTTAKKITCMLFWMCHIVTAPNNQCSLHWGYEIVLCPTFAWLSLSSATSPLLLAWSSLLWCATFNSSFLLLIISHEGFVFPSYKASFTMKMAAMRKANSISGRPSTYMVCPGPLAPT